MGPQGRNNRAEDLASDLDQPRAKARLPVNFPVTGIELVYLGTGLSLGGVAD